MGERDQVRSFVTDILYVVEWFIERVIIAPSSGGECGRVAAGKREV